MEDLVDIKKAADLEGIPYQNFRQRLHRKRIATFPHPTDGSKRMVRVSDLSDEAQERYRKEQADAAIQPAVSQPHHAVARSDPQGSLAFMIPGRLEGELLAAVPPVAESQRPYVEKWAAILGDHRNGTWRRFEGKVVGGIVVTGSKTFLRGRAKEEGIGVATIYEKLRIMREVESDASVPPEKKAAEIWRRILPSRPAGRSAHTFFSDPENSWMGPKLLDFYLTQAKHSVKRAWELLILEINAKQAVWRAAHDYQKPKQWQARTYLRKVDRATLALNREGNKAFNDRCSAYISRDPESLRSNDVWVTDQKQCDDRLRGSGEQLGRIWMVSFFDARSWKVMGYWFGPILSSDMVISAAAMAISRHGVPKAILMDLGKEFACTAFSGSFRKIKGETLLREAQGMCQRLGIDVIKAIGRNPQTKPIERWHRELARFDHNIPGWCGGNTSERPEVLAELERQHEEWKRTERGKSPLFTIQQYLCALVNWIENDWNAQHRGRGKYLGGMTPNECWNTHLPEGGVRRITDSELELATADHRVLKVARGGQINITLYGQTIEYQSPELFLRQGEELEVIISRRTLSRITVLDRAINGRFLCEAAAKPLFHWGLRAPEDREELRQAIRVRNAAKKAVNRGNAARRVLEVTATPAEIGQQTQPIREISSTEFRSRKFKRMTAPKTMTSGELARRIFDLQEEV